MAQRVPHRWTICGSRAEGAALPAFEGAFRRGDVRGDSDLGGTRRDPADEKVGFRRLNRLDARFHEPISRRHEACANLLDEQARLGLTHHDGGSRFPSSEHGCLCAQIQLSFLTTPRWVPAPPAKCALDPAGPSNS